MPKIAERYFIVDGSHAFVPTETPGLYALTHPSALFVHCPYCDVPAGRRCIGNDGKTWATEVHYSRREDAAGRSRIQEALAGKRIGKLP